MEFKEFKWFELSDEANVDNDKRHLEGWFVTYVDSYKLGHT